MSEPEYRHRLAAFRCFPEFDDIPPEKVKWVREGVYDLSDGLREDVRRVAQALADADNADCFAWRVHWDNSKDPAHPLPRVSRFYTNKDDADYERDGLLSYGVTKAVVVCYRGRADG